MRASLRGPGGFHLVGGGEGGELSTFEQDPSGYVEGTARDGGEVTALVQVSSDEGSGKCA